MVLGACFIAAVFFYGINMFLEYMFLTPEYREMSRATLARNGGENEFGNAIMWADVGFE